MADIDQNNEKTTRTRKKMIRGPSHKQHTQTNGLAGYSTGTAQCKIVEWLTVLRNSRSSRSPTSFPRRSASSCSGSSDSSCSGSSDSSSVG